MVLDAKVDGYVKQQSGKSGFLLAKEMDQVSFRKFARRRWNSFRRSCSNVSKSSTNSLGGAIMWRGTVKANL